jgi:biotin-dependent carboxylase-like uncharacterized protein
MGPQPMHEILVAYDGPDVDRVCSMHGISRERLVAMHSGPEYLVEVIGFLPGFGYLTGLPPGLATPRLDTPRRRVPAGSVGIGGSRTGVYPFASPGGWNLIGRTNTVLFDVSRPQPALLQTGDRVRFVPSELPPTEPPKEARPARATGTAGITVLEPGLFTTVQDLGRPGYRSSGVPLSGAVDPVAMRLANLVVGNPEDTAGLECTLVGPTLRFDRDAVVAMVGGAFPGLPMGVATHVAAGTVVALGHATHGCRGYLAIAGGIAVEPVLGSRSTLLTAAFGGFQGRSLAKGDLLPIGKPDRPPSRNGALALIRRLTTPERPCVLRVVPGADAHKFDQASWARTYRASSRSDRMGLRLDGEPLCVTAGMGGMVSIPVAPGTVQVPPDGLPIILLADAQTFGGYPVLGQVIEADLPKAARMRPGDEIHFQPVTLDEADAARRDLEATLAAVRESIR